MYRNLLPAQCHACGEEVPRAAAHRCPICLNPFSRMPLDQTRTRPKPEMRRRPMHRDGE